MTIERLNKRYWLKAAYVSLAIIVVTGGLYGYHLYHYQELSETTKTALRGEYRNILKRTKLMQLNAKKFKKENDQKLKFLVDTQRIENELRDFFRIVSDHNPYFMIRKIEVEEHDLYINMADVTLHTYPKGGANQIVVNMLTRIFVEQFFPVVPDSVSDEENRVMFSMLNEVPNE